MNYGFDIDNTIYHAKDEKSTKLIKSALNTLLENGHFITFITRREKYNLTPIMELLNKHPNTNVICANGCYDLSGKLTQRYIDNSNEICTYLKKNNYHFLVVTKFGYKMYNEGSLEPLKDFYQKQTNEIKNVTSIMIASKQNNQLEDFLKVNNLKYTYNDIYENYTVDHPKVNKQEAVKMLGLKLDIAAGDSMIDDYEFVKAAKYSFWLNTNELTGVINLDKEELAHVLLTIR